MAYTDLEQQVWGLGPQSPCCLSFFPLCHVPLESSPRSQPGPEQLGWTLAPVESLVSPVYKVVFKGRRG